MSSQQQLFGVKIAADHSNQGKEFEQHLEGVHDWYRLQGWADIRKVPHAWAFISQQEYTKLLAKLPAGHLAKTENGRFMQRVKSDVDFTGGGENFSIAFSICFDAKQTKGNRFPLANLEAHQLQKLKERNKCGILAGIMLNFSELDRVFFVPYKYLNLRFENWQKSFYVKRAAKGSASISIDETVSEATEIFKNRRNGFWDWLPCLIKG